MTLSANWLLVKRPITVDCAFVVMIMLCTAPLSPSCVLAVEGATGQWDVFMGLHGPPLGTLTVGSGVVLNANSVVAITGYPASLCG